MGDLLDAFNDQQAQSTFNPQDVEKNKIVAMIPYVFPILFFLPIVVDKNSTFCKFHANQQLAELILWVALGIVSAILGFIPVLGAICGLVIWTFTILLGVVLLLAAGKGKAIRIPFIGALFEIF